MSIFERTFAFTLTEKRVKKERPRWKLNTLDHRVKLAAALQKGI